MAREASFRKSALTKLGNELKKINSSATASLQEGLEETLTIYKLKGSFLYKVEILD